MSSASHTASEANEIRRLIEAWAQAVRRKDMEGILANHSADIVMFDVPPPFQSVGLDEYKATWDKFFACNNLGVFNIDEMAVTTGDDVAFVVALMRCAEREPDGSRVDLQFRLTMGLRKIADRWTIVHEHHSVPAV